MTDRCGSMAIIDVCYLLNSRLGVELVIVLAMIYGF
jgi:hypothetical protein